jgi:hypothetical protein
MLISWLLYGQEGGGDLSIGGIAESLARLLLFKHGPEPVAESRRARVKPHKDRYFVPDSLLRYPQLDVMRCLAAVRDGAL